MLKKIDHIKYFIKGFSTYSTANKFIFRNKLWPYLLFPGIMSILYVSLLIIFGILYFPDFSNFINTHLIPGFLKGSAMTIVTLFLLWIFAILIGYISYQQVVLILFSPVLGYISEIVEKIVCNESPPDFNWKHFIKDIYRSFIINIKNMILMMVFTFLAWILSIFPVIGMMISPPLILLIHSYYGGFGLIDFTLERRRYSIKDSFEFNRKNRGLTTGVGFGFILLLMLPIIGWMMAPGYGTVAATLAAIEKINESHEAM